MEAQLRLLSAPEVTPPRIAAPDGPDDADAPSEADQAPALESGPMMWRLSASTRAVGRQGIESARAALRHARPTSRDHETAGEDAHGADRRAGRRSAA